MQQALTQPEIRLRFIFKFLLLISVVLIVFHLFPNWVPERISGIMQDGYRLFSNGSMVQAVLLVLLMGLIIGDIRRFNQIIRVVIVFLIVDLIFTLLHLMRNTNTETEKNILFWSAGIDLILLVTLSVCNRAAGKSRYNLKYLSVRQFQTLQALAEVCIAGDSDAWQLEIKPVEVASNVDGYLISFEAKSKWVMKMVLSCMEFYPLFSLHMPLSLMLPDARLQFLKRRFLTDEEFRSTPDWWRQMIQAAIRMSKQLCYMGYYSDERVYKSIGYQKFTERPDFKDRFKTFPDSHSKSDQLQVLVEKDLANSEIVADVVIVGSGAAASILANQLIEHGRKVLLVERGKHVDPRDFNEKEVDMVSRLYQNGALQLSRDFRFQVFQGSCVGGSTVVNNAACFKTPDYILDRWINEMGIGLDRERYLKSMDSLYALLHVSHTPQMTDDTFLNPGGRLFSDACRKMGYALPELDSIMANIEGCLGCGYCNIGCKYGRKLSMLDTILPLTQISHPGSLQIIAGCEVLSFNRDSGSNRIKSITGQFDSGKKITIKGNTFVSSAGAVSSSILLIKSKLGIANAGKKLSFNLGSQITAVYDQVVNSYDGLQISHFLKTDDRRYVMETWFNPPMFQSTAMPGWFDQHFRNMREYNKMACTGVLVGTASNATVKAAGLLGRDIDYEPTEEDFNSLMDALTKVSEIYLNGGATRVMPNTFNYYEYRDIPDLKERIRKDVKASRDIATGTGHPQGGNVMSNDPATGVVDSQFKVFGFENLYVCDASVFPTSLGLNPQITVMSLAYYAAPLIAKSSK
jgi:choline dehydrogenase-like flavoprotein